TPLGVGVDTYWKNALAGQSGVRTIERLDCSDLAVKFGGEVQGFDAGQWLDRKSIKNTDPFVHYAVAASDLALEDAGLSIGEGGADRARTGAVIGSGIGGLLEIEQQCERFFRRGPSRVSPFFVPKMMANAAAGHVAIRFGIQGPNFATTSACASSTHAFGTALMLMRAGVAEVMLAGGSEAALTRLAIAGFASARALSKRNDDPAAASRPFDTGRDGFVMGEGAGIFVLETLEHAKARGARIYAELAGYGASDDGHHMTAPEPEGRGATQAMAQALKDAGMSKESVTLVSAHGTSTPLGDVAETLAVKRTFGDHAHSLVVTATKSSVGHLLGAAGAISAAAAVLAIHRGEVPPTINLDEPDPACDLDYVPNTARSLTVEAAMANAFGFGGHNASLLFRRYA
ncbi:MAG: beta-ketoacyl-ACP synthase II, partial [Planctomycetota bacterium]